MKLMPQLTDENINAAITWYKANKEAIQAALPIHRSGILYKKGVLEPLSRFISFWEKGTMPLNLAGCYIYKPIRDLYAALEQKKKQTENDIDILD